MNPIDLYNALIAFLLQHISTISFGMIAAVLVLFGDPIIKFQKKILKRFHFLFRLTAFVILAGIGFSLMAFWSESILTKALLNLPRDLLPPTILAIFFILGIMAERKRFM